MNTKNTAQELLFQEFLKKLFIRPTRRKTWSICLLLFFSHRTEQDQIILQVKSYYRVVLDAKWRFGTVLFTAYIRH